MENTVNELYKNCQIYVLSSENSGRWQATARIIASEIREMKGFGLLITGGFKTQAEAETEVLMRIKKRIDEAAR